MRKRLMHVDVKKVWVYFFLLFFLAVLWNLVETPVFATGVLFGACGLLAYRYRLQKFPLFLGLLALSLRILIVFFFQTPATSDFKVLLDASRSLLQGDRSYLGISYFQLWAYQNGFVAYQSLLLWFWNSITILKLANCLLSSATVVLVYLLAREFASARAARYASLVYCFLPFPLFYVTILSNQFLASFLIYLGLYILISSRFQMRRPFKYLIFAILLSVANVIRPESVIPLFSGLVFLVLTITKANLKERLVEIAILLGVYFTLNWLFSQLFIVTGLSPLGLTNNAPHWKFVLGLNHDTYGRYADADAPYLKDSVAAWAVVRQRVLVPLPQLLELFQKKIQLFWDGSGLYWPLGCFLENGVTALGQTFRISDDYAVWQGMSKYGVVILYLLVTLGLFQYVRKKDRNVAVLLPMTQIFVTFGVYLLIEVQSRYAYHVQISVAILAALGFDALHDFLTKKRCLPQ